jgi:hypothetical protein
MARKKLSSPDGPTSRERRIVRQIDALEEQSNSARESVLGAGWDDEVESFYNMTPTLDPAPNFRPRISIPQLQREMLSEASDLSDVSPVIYIVKKDKSERDKKLEEALQAQWKHGNFNMEILKATIWALFSGNGYIEVGFDPNAMAGDGEVWVKSRDPKSVAPDPFAGNDKDLSYVILKDQMYIDEMRARWPDQGYRVKKQRPGAPQMGSSRLALLPGPMSSVGGMPSPGTIPLPTGGVTAGDDSRVTVRKIYIDDYEVEEVPDAKKQNKQPDNLIAKPQYRPVYPHGRTIVECEGVVLLDGENPFAGGVKPISSVWGVPPLNSYFAPPTIKYTKDLQYLAERMYTQVYENAVRLNNGISYIDESTGIDIEEFGNLPAEVHMIATGSKSPETKWPAALPAHMLELPKLLLDMDREYQGFTPSRRGAAPQGNVSAPLFDATILQSQSMTRLRSKFLAVTIQRIAEQVFGVMAKFYTAKRAFPIFVGQEYKPVEWAPLDDYDPTEYLIMVDAASVEPYSATTMRMMLPMLKQFGAIDTETLLEMLKFPNRQEIMERIGKEQQQAAQAKAAGAKPSGKKR